jgi:hypothetical protein
MTDKLNIVLVHGGNRAFAETDVDSQNACHLPAF